jgi:plastocyanin
MLARSSLALLIALTGCSSSDSKPLDASGQAPAEAAMSSVRTVTCPPGQMPTVTTSGNGNGATYVPTSTTISVGGIVEFIMPAVHNVAPNTTSSDPGLEVDYGATVCLSFMKAGTYNFHCQAHGFTGAVLVQ